MSTQESYYVVSSSWYEDYDPRIVVGPVVDDWPAFCKSLLPEAVESALAHEECWIGWSDIADGLLRVLESRGYRRTKPPEANFWGSCIIREESDDKDNLLSGAMMRKIAAHNKGVEDDCGITEIRERVAREANA